MSDFAHRRAVLRASHERLQVLVDEITPDGLEGRSACAEWSIAQVLSHLGSQAEIFDLILTAALDGGDVPDRSAFPPIWDRWNAMSPLEQATNYRAATEAFLARVDAIDDEQASGMSIALFGQTFDAAGLMAIRLSEHALHAWDVAVVLDEGARLPKDVVGILIDEAPRVAGRGAAVDGGRSIGVATFDPQRAYVLDTAGVTLTPHATREGELSGEVTIGAENLIRLVYGRLSAENLDAEGSNFDGVELDELNKVFPGF